MASDFTSPTGSPALVMYDVAFAPPYEKNTSAPNPWKARYALNFKGVAYSTQWVQLADIKKVRQGLGVAPCRKFMDGSDFYTLPIVTDSTTGSAVGDSLDIASYLQDKFPDAGAGHLFPSQNLDYECPGAKDFVVPLSAEQSSGPLADYARFNTNVDMAFTLHAQLTAEGMSWDPTKEAEIKAEFARRAGAASWDDLLIYGEAREKLKLSLRDTLRDLAALLQRDDTGPFMLGSQPSYADIIIGGWLRMLSKSMPASEWEEVQAWHDGVFGKLHAALQERFGDVK